MCSMLWVRVHCVCIVGDTCAALCISLCVVSVYLCSVCVGCVMCVCCVRGVCVLRVHDACALFVSVVSVVCACMFLSVISRSLRLRYRRGLCVLCVCSRCGMCVWGAMKPTRELWGQSFSWSMQPTFMSKPSRCGLETNC